MPQYHILWLLLLLLLPWIAVGAATGASNVISDVNNMLRDVTPTNMGATKAAAAASLDSAQPSSVELLRFVDDDTEPEGQANSLTLDDQVRLLTKQMNALMLRRREDYELLERNLRKSLRLTTVGASVDENMRTELEQLRQEVKTLREAHNGNDSSNKQRLTVEWLQQSISEIRKQLVDVQRAASSVAKEVQQQQQQQQQHIAGYVDLATIRDDFEQMKLELAAQRERQQQTEVFMQELREELLQQEEENTRLLSKRGKQHMEQQSASIEQLSDSQEDDSGSDTLADHKRRHCRFQQQEIHALQMAQRNLRRQVNELKYHHIDERVRIIELEQHRIANANFNLSRQIASLDKLHASMLELLEDVEELQSKMDKSVPELRHEISKLEFANAQISSEQSMLREEGKNMARSLQAMAVSVSVLQDERDGVRKMMSSVAQLQTNVDRMQSLVNTELKNQLSHANKPHKQAHSQPQQQRQQYAVNDGDYSSALAASLVTELEHVEAQYESIINKLPHDCSDVSTNADGLHLIAPAGQHHPLLTHCTADGWTTVQRRFDGSADFNRSWADYAHGFGLAGGEFWIGNEQLHHLTFNNCSQLRVHMQDIYNNVWVADYGYFYISSRDDGYRLHIADYSGNASDALNYQQSMQFSAIDDDRDISQTHCAANYEGGWWFSHCQHANLNGRYNLGLTWFDAGRNEWIAVKSSQMMVKRRPTDACAAAFTASATTTTGNGGQLAATAALTTVATAAATTV